MSIITCNGCGEQFGGDGHGESGAFDQHNCPAIPEPMQGESFADFKARSAAYRADWKARATTTGDL